MPSSPKITNYLANVGARLRIQGVGTSIRVRSTFDLLSNVSVLARCAVLETALVPPQSEAIGPGLLGLSHKPVLQVHYQVHHQVQQ